MKEVDKWLEYFRALWEERFSNLDIVLRNLKTKRKNHEHDRKNHEDDVHQ